MMLVQKRWVNGSDLNTKGVLFGGRMLSWVDEDASILAFDKGYGDCDLVTVGLSMAKFVKPITAGDCLTFYYKIVHISHSTMTIRADVESKNLGWIVFTTFITFAAVKDGKPIELKYKCLVLNPDDDDYKFVERFRKFLKESKS